MTEHPADWSIQQLARLTGTTSRTLRHYDDLGVLPPTRIAANGYRHYDRAALVRLQRILLLRDLGLGLPAIRAVLDGHTDDVAALTTHLALLVQERDRVDRQLASVERTLQSLQRKEPLMADQMFDGFDHTQYREEVIQRWGEQSWASSDRWWRSMSADEKAQWRARQAELAGDWKSAAAAGLDPRGEAGQALAARHAAWLASIPGTPHAPDGSAHPDYLVGLGAMYVADERFAAKYGGTTGATFVRDALAAYVEAL